MNAVLAGIEQESGIDVRESGAFIGTSAGSIVAAALAAGMRPASRLGRLPEQPPVADEAAADGGSAARRVLGALSGAAAPVAGLALSTMAPGGALLRRAALGRVPRGRISLADLGREVERTGVEWDGRLLVSAVELETGRRVMLGSPDAPGLSVAQAVMASCAIPGAFRPVSYGGRSYVDGGAWSPTNMDAADVDSGDRVLCLNPTGSLRPSFETPAGALGPVSRSVAGAEALVLRGRGAEVETINPDRRSVEAFGPNLMDPRPRAKVIAAGLAQGRRIANRHAVGANS